VGAPGPDPKETQYIDPEEFHSRSFKESLSYAWEGLVYVYSNERNMRIHVLMGSIVISACFVCGMGRVEFFMVVLAILGVLTAEILNTLIESLVDLLEPEFNPIAKRVKDIAAAGVLLTAGFSVVIGILAFYPILSDLPSVWQEFCAYRWRWLVACSIFFILPSLWGMIVYNRKST